MQGRPRRVLVYSILCRPTTARGPGGYRPMTAFRLLMVSVLQEILQQSSQNWNLAIVKQQPVALLGWRPPKGLFEQPFPIRRLGIRQPKAAIADHETTTC